MKSSTGYIFLHNHNIVVQFNGNQIESLAPVVLSEIKTVKEFDTTGYFVLDTNYGEEYLDLEYVLSSLGCDEIKLVEELSLIDRFEVKESVTD